MTYTHEANGKQFLIVEIDKTELNTLGELSDRIEKEVENLAIDINKTKFSCIAEKATEAQAAMVVASDFINCIHCECGGEQCPGYFGRKLDAHPDCEGVFSHYEYLQSLIRANFTDTNFNHLILEIL